MTSARTFPGVPASASAARRFVAGVLASAGLADTGTAELIVSELVGNAVRHSRSGLAGGRVRVAVTVAAGDWARVDVRDDGPAVPGRVPVVPAAEPPADAPGGRGLWLVAKLAPACGSDGKGLFWARLPWDAGDTAAAEDDGALFALPGAGGTW
jgi:anti-sigma regulatory factor (Ser/Thr protein kinase)